MLPCATLDNLSTQGVALTTIVEVDAHLALFPLLEVAHDTAPLALATLLEGTLIVGRAVRLKAEDLDTRTRCLVHHYARAHHARIIKYEHRTLGQVVCHRAKVALRDCAIVVNEQLRRRALRQRKLGDTLIRKVVVIVVDIYMSFHSGTKVEKKLIFVNFFSC